MEANISEETLREESPQDSACSSSTTGTAAAERVFSLLKNSFNERQDLALQDYLEASLMLQYNRDH